MKAIYKGLIITSKTQSTLKILSPGYLVVSEKGVIEDVTDKNPQKKYGYYRFYDFSGYLICPGFIDTHNHLPQYAFAGIGEKELLPWLKKYTFPREKKFSSKKLATESAKIFFHDLLANGTTTTLTYATIHKSAAEIAFMQAQKAKIRAVIGKVMMDQNSPAFLTEKTKQSLKDSEELIEKWHGRDGRLFYALTPRFAISCTFPMMKEIGKIAKERNVYIQTHLAENPDEIKFVKKLFPKCGNYTDVYARAGLLGPKTIMAHCVYLQDSEITAINKSGTRIAHCPTSNRFLMSGIMPFRKYRTVGIDMALGTDVAGGYSLSMLNEMKEAIESSKSLSVCTDGKSGVPMTLAEAFYLATLGGAKVLSMEDKIGSLEKGKKADFLVIDHLSSDSTGKKSDYLKPEQILSKIIYRGSAQNIRHVFIEGEKIR